MKQLLIILVGFISTHPFAKSQIYEITTSDNQPIEFNISNSLSGPNASTGTLSLYRFLSNNFGKKIISGVMTLKSLSTISGENQNEISWLYQKTGKKPALLGLDFMDHTGNLPASWINNPDIIADAKTWKKANGIVAFCWHWRDPSHKTADFYTEKTDFDARKIVEPASTEYAAMMRDLDIVANYLKELDNNGVPVLWRPLHEAAGKWFWWGARGPEACKEIWRIMFNKFENEYKLNNLIWVWTSNTSDDALDWYPGDEYVDVIGLDNYDKSNHASQALNFNSLKDFFQGKKLLTMSECGSIPGPDPMSEDQTIWSYFMPWYGEHTKNSQWNSIDFWTKTLSDSRVITLDEMPSDVYTSNGKIQPLQSQVSINNHLLTIQTSSENSYSFHIYDLFGKSCLFVRHNLGAKSISLSGYNQGIYLLVIENGSLKETHKIRIG